MITPGSARGKEKISTAVVETSGSELMPNSGFESVVESTSMKITELT